MGKTPKLTGWKSLKIKINEEKYGGKDKQCEVAMLDTMLVCYYAIEHNENPNEKGE